MTAKAKVISSLVYSTEEGIFFITAFSPPPIAIIIAIMPCGALRDFSIFRALASSSGVISATRQMSSSVPKAGLASNRVTKVRAGFR